MNLLDDILSVLADIFFDCCRSPRKFLLAAGILLLFTAVLLSYFYGKS